MIHQFESRQNAAAGGEPVRGQVIKLVSVGVKTNLGIAVAEVIDIPENQEKRGVEYWNQRAPIAVGKTTAFAHE